jgi:H+/Cl- antiporter ClcA
MIRLLDLLIRRGNLLPIMTTQAQSPMTKPPAHAAFWLARWLVLVVPLAVLTGSAMAFFLWALVRVTELRWSAPWLIYLLPLAGIFVVWVYARFGGDSDRGNNLIIDEIHEEGAGVPRRMAVLVLWGTLVTHLFGGSAGREGTAVQMGGSIASGLARAFHLNGNDRRQMLMCGVAAGFGAIFGTPVAGAVFALEVLVQGRIKFDSLIPCLAAALLGDAVCHWWGAHHTIYTIEVTRAAAESAALWAQVLVAAVAFGLAARLFIRLSHDLTDLWRARIKRYWLRPVAGASLVVLASVMLGTDDYLGLGVTTRDGTGTSIVNAFVADSSVDPMGWFWKLLLTAITVSCGFKGGEVTPLFFIGATLGHTMAHLTGAPVDLLAGIGFVAVFAAATNTPLACTIMAVELFGAEWLPLFAVSCFLAHLVSGKAGIYKAQRLPTPSGESKAVARL